MVKIIKKLKNFQWQLRSGLITFKNIKKTVPKCSPIHSGFTTGCYCVHFICINCISLSEITPTLVVGYLAHLYCRFPWTVFVFKPHDTLNYLLPALPSPEVGVGVTHPARDALDLPSAEWLKVHTDVTLHGCEQLLGGAVGGVGLLPPVSLVPTGDNPLVFTAKHVQVICLWGSEKGRYDMIYGDCVLFLTKCDLLFIEKWEPCLWIWF